MINARCSSRLGGERSGGQWVRRWFVLSRLGGERSGGQRVRRWFVDMV